jgi:hypothetical protein
MSVNLFNGGGNTPPVGAKPPESGNTPPVDKPPAVYRYRCVEACVFQKRYRKEGDTVELPEKRDALPHFVPVI